MAHTTYGYARISRKEQSIERQMRNIKAYNADAVIFAEAYTGTKVQGRKVFEKLLKLVKSGDTIVFDSVSRMSRNATEGMELYEQLMGRGVELVFLKEHHIDTATYKTAAQSVEMTGNAAVDAILNGVNKALSILRRQQIEQAFEQAEKEVQDLRQRTREGLITAKANGQQVGHAAGTIQLHVKKQDEMLPRIKALSKSFDGHNTDAEVMAITGLARNTFYKYKAMLLQEQGA